MYEPYEYYLKSDQWKEKKRKRIEIDGNKCALCGSGLNLQVHHRSYKNLGYENICNDLITLCSNCHELVHSYKNTPMEVRTNEKLDSCNYHALSAYSKRIALQFAKENESKDLSANRNGLNFCDYAVIKPMLKKYFEEHGLINSPLGVYPSVVQHYFTQKRYAIILQMKKNGLTAQKIAAATGFSYKSISKVFEAPEQALEVIYGKRISINTNILNILKED